MAVFLGAIDDDSVSKGTGKGDYSIKEHLSNGRKTACNRNSLNKLDKEQFIRTYEKYPEMCCLKCVEKAKQYNLIKK